MSEVITLILQDISSPPEDVKLEKLIENSEGFPIKFPIDTARCKVLQQSVDKDVLEANINSTYPVLHENAVKLYANFILEKRKGGSLLEKNFYRNFTVLKLVQRILEKRAVTFVGIRDHYTLIDGRESYGGWETVGTDAEVPPLILEKCLSYDEMKLSAFLSISSHTYFINKGHRKNRGKPDPDRAEIEDNGVVVGLIGPRLVKPNVMEHQDIVFSQLSLQTIPNLMKEFYNVSHAYSGITRSYSSDCVRVKDKFFDVGVYRKRLAVSFDTFLLEANQRAKDANKKAFVHIVGIGLGVWRLSSYQEAVFLDEFACRITALGDSLHFISDVRFGYFESIKCGQYSSGEKIPIAGHPSGGIKIQISFDDPHLKLKGEDEGKLLVVSFAWDSNSLPGNEYWGGCLHTSSDSAAACSTQVTELHNAHINPKCSKDNLRVATNSGVVTFSEYQQMLRETS